MANVYGFIANGRDVLVVDCDADLEIDVEAAKVSAGELKKTTGVSTVVVQHGAAFWVV